MGQEARVTNSFPFQPKTKLAGFEHSYLKTCKICSSNFATLTTNEFAIQYFFCQNIFDQQLASFTGSLDVHVL